MSEQAELWRKTGQRGLLITSYKSLEKKIDRAITPAMEAVCVPKHLALPGSLKAKQLHHLHAQLSLRQSYHRPKKKKKSCVYAHTVTSFLSDSLWPCWLWHARLLCQRWGSPANTGCHTLLEHYISCCPSYQSPWVPGAARTPVTQAAVTFPHLTLTEANPSPPKEASGAKPKGAMRRGGNKATIETQGQCG